MAKPRYTYRDTGKGTWRHDSKTGKRIWRKLGNPFPEEGRKKKKKKKR